MPGASRNTILVGRAIVRSFVIMLEPLQIAERQQEHYSYVVIPSLKLSQRYYTVSSWQQTLKEGLSV
jgi:hypothetical protein